MPKPRPWRVGRCVSRPFEEAAYVVCIGLNDAEHETPADYQPRLAAMLAHDVEFICANPDIVVEMGDKLVYCAGALAESYAAMGGRVIQAGKPYAQIYERVPWRWPRSCAAPRLCAPRVLAIGDSAQTDIKGGKDQGLARYSLQAAFIAPNCTPSRRRPARRGGFHQFLEGSGLAPMAAIAELVW